jgi:orotidine 5'-phosphate decarboxylase subfamily 1
VKLQYQRGVYRISEWAHLTNAHALLGPGTIQGLKEVGEPLGRGLLLLSETSAQGNLITPDYSQAVIDMARKHSDFVMGFITQKRRIDDPSFIHFTPGVHLAAEGDALGQSYNSPEWAIGEQGSDIILVGRGITQAEDPVKAAQNYQKAGWEAYEMLLSSGCRN